MSSIIERTRVTELPDKRKIKRKDIDYAISTEVMGWWATGNGRWAERGTNHDMKWFTAWRPSADLRDSFEALEKWLMIDSVMRRVSIAQCWDRNGDSHSITWHVSIRKTRDRFEEFIGDDKSIELAICLALLSAVRGVTVELED